MNCEIFSINTVESFPWILHVKGVEGTIAVYEFIVWRNSFYWLWKSRKVWWEIVKVILSWSKALLTQPPFAVLCQNNDDVALMIPVFSIDPIIYYSLLTLKTNENIIVALHFLGNSFISLLLLFDTWSIRK